MALQVIVGDEYGAAVVEHDDPPAIAVDRALERAGTFAGLVACGQEPSRNGQPADWQFVQDRLATTAELDWLRNDLVGGAIVVRVGGDDAVRVLNLPTCDLRARAHARNEDLDGARRSAARAVMAAALGL